MILCCVSDAATESPSQPAEAQSAARLAGISAWPANISSLTTTSCQAPLFSNTIAYKSPAIREPWRAQDTSWNCAARVGGMSYGLQERHFCSLHQGGRRPLVTVAGMANEGDNVTSLRAGGAH